MRFFGLICPNLSFALTSVFYEVGVERYLLTCYGQYIFVVACIARSAYIQLHQVNFPWAHMQSHLLLCDYIRTRVYVLLFDQFVFFFFMTESALYEVCHCCSSKMLDAGRMRQHQPQLICRDQIMQGVTIFSYFRRASLTCILYQSFLLFESQCLDHSSCHYIQSFPIWETRRLFPNFDTISVLTCHKGSCFGICQPACWLAMRVFFLCSLLVTTCAQSGN